MCTVKFGDLSEFFEEEEIPQEHRDLVEALCDTDHGLTAWEMDFVESVARQIENGRALSDAQEEKARQILERLEG